jgi:hypothetical protein
VSRGGWLARRLLIVASGAFCVAAALAGAAPRTMIM